MSHPDRSKRPAIHLALALLTFAAPLLAAACSTEGKPAALDAGSTAPPSAAASASAAPTGSAENRRDEIEPVYPLTHDPPDPRAEKLCAALHELPGKRKAACCGTSPGVAFTSECVRTLSYALAHGAVTVNDADIEQCRAAMERSLEGCAWTSPMAPGVPAACDGILRGALAEKARCRSSLECAEGLRCRGVGPTHVGVCAPPLAAGGLCAIAVDPLATYTRQVGFEAHHPECTGYCGRRRCAEQVPAGAPCESRAECAGNNHCVRGKCSEVTAPPAGKPCIAQLCAEGARCLKGLCVTPKENGEPCADDSECRASCKRGDGGVKGVCGNYCGD